MLVLSCRYTSRHFRSRDGVSGRAAGPGKLKNINKFAYIKTTPMRLRLSTNQPYVTGMLRPGRIRHGHGYYSTSHFNYIVFRDTSFVLTAGRQMFIYAPI